MTADQRAKHEHVLNELDRAANTSREHGEQWREAWIAYAAHVGTKPGGLWAHELACEWLHGRCKD